MNIRVADLQEEVMGDGFRKIKWQSHDFSVS